MIYPVLCPKCKAPMGGPAFEEKHRVQVPVRILGDGDACMLHAYWECKACNTKLVIDPNWQENTRTA